MFRKEIKYVISLLDYSLIQKKLDCFLELDANGGQEGYLSLIHI